MSRNKIPIDWKVVDEKLSHFCEGTEIAAYLGITEDTLYNRVKEVFSLDFSVYKAQKRAKGETILRELQLKSAMNGNIVMQIWLGKQYLSQSDKQDHTTGGDKIQPINITVVKPEQVEKYKSLKDYVGQLN